MQDAITIRNLRVRPVSVPVRIQPVAATGAIPAMPLVLIDLETEQGITGRAYLFAITALALRPVIEALHGLAGIIQGDR